MSARERELAARFGFTRETTLEARREEALSMHYVGFDNPALLSSEDNRGIGLYTNGIVGCNVVVLGSAEGAYMAHVDVRPLFDTPHERVREHMRATIGAFRDRLNPDETLAYIVTGGTAHPGIIDALSDSNILTEIENEQQFGIRIGGLSGSPHINSTFNLRNEECERNNLLPPELQWTPFFERELGIRQELSKRYMASTESSRAREAAIAEERRVREEAIRKGRGR
mgnify:CR=1 FL=1